MAVALLRRARCLFRTRCPDGHPLTLSEADRKKLLLEWNATTVVHRPEASVHALFEDADHSFHVPARTGKKDPEIRSAMLDAFAGWVDSIL